MKFSAQQIADLLGGSVEGNPEVMVNNLCKIEEGKEGEMSFLSNPKYEPYIYDSKASIIIVNNDFEPSKSVSSTLIRVADSYKAFARILEVYNQYRLNRVGISELASISQEAKHGDEVYLGDYVVVEKGAIIGDSAKIYPQVFIGENVRIGNNAILYPGVKIYHDCVIGDNCIIHSGAVIGSDGFGFAPLEDGSFHKIPQIGNVIIEENVEIGANTSIDRATMGSTVIKKGTKIDNLCQIAHNVEIGQNTVMAAQTGVAGTTKIGSYCFIGGQVGFSGHITIGDNVKIAAQSGIMSNVEDGEELLGSPAFRARDFMRSFAIFKRLPEVWKKLRELDAN